MTKQSVERVATQQTLHTLDFLSRELLINEFSTAPTVPLLHNHSITDLILMKLTVHKSARSSVQLMDYFKVQLLVCYITSIHFIYAPIHRLCK